MLASERNALDNEIKAALTPAATLEPGVPARELSG
jgi:hypothetical protein